LRVTAALALSDASIARTKSSRSGSPELTGSRLDFDLRFDFGFACFDFPTAGRIGFTRCTGGFAGAGVASVWTSVSDIGFSEG
jgi:hypothetical protein